MKASLYCTLCACFGLSGLALFAYGIQTGLKTDCGRAIAGIGAVVAVVFSFISIKTQLEARQKNRVVETTEKAR